MVISNRGAQSSLSELLLFESKQVPGVPLNDVQEVSSYVAALQFGLRNLRQHAPSGLATLPRLTSPQNGHVTPRGTSFAVLCGPDTVKVFLHFAQVVIFSIPTSLHGCREALWEPCSF